MAQSGLSVESASGGQTTTASPQSRVSGNSAGLAGQKSSGVQPGTATSLLTTSSGGVTLGNTALTTVNLDSRTASTGSVQPASVTPSSSHHLSPALLIIALVLLIAAAGFTWQVTRSAKNTTI